MKWGGKKDQQNTSLNFLRVLDLTDTKPLPQAVYEQAPWQSTGPPESTALTQAGGSAARHVEESENDKPA